MLEAFANPFRRRPAASWSKMLKTSFIDFCRQQELNLSVMAGPARPFFIKFQRLREDAAGREMKLNACFFKLICVCVLILLSGLAQAQQEAIGYVKTVTGDAWITTMGQRVKAELGTAVMIGSQIKTEPGASLGVTFKDNTVMSFGPDTEMNVDAYTFAPAQGHLKLVTQMIKGSLNYVSGLIAKLEPEAVTIKTPSGIIGVRGTQFLLQVDPAK